MNEAHISSNGAIMEVDSLRFTIRGSKTCDYTEESAMDAIAGEISNLLGDNSSVRLTKCGGSHVINIIQPNYRLSEILPKEISEWINASHDADNGSDQHFEIILPHSISVNAGSGVEAKEVP